jgi:hypothetical protein
MALGITDVEVTANLEGSDRKVVVLTITGDAAYGAGGYAVTPAQLQLSTIDGIFFTSTGVASDMVATYNPATGKIVFQVMSTAAEASGNVSAFSFRALAIGQREV